jgi:fumarate reductase flavoprotein subunit
MNSEKMETQVAVIGGGGAGLTAAVAAAEKGADVTVLEKRHALGGNSAMAEGFLAAESPAQKRMRIDARRDEIFRMAMDYAHWRLNARIVRAFVNKSGDTVRWLEDKGLYFDWIPSYFPGQRIPTWHCLKNRGAELIEILVRECKDKGVRILKEMGAKRLLTDDKGRITGVIAGEKKKEIMITAGCIIIATGGYGGNEELLKKYNAYYNENVVRKGIPHTGDGLLMAIEIGAATEGLGLLQFSGHTPHAAADDLLVTSDEPNTIWLNKKGERFTDEATSFNRFESVNAVLRQPGSFCYTILDRKIVQDIEQKGVIKGAGCVVLPCTKLPGLEKALESAEKKGNGKIADSWDEIAEWMEVKPSVLKATIDEYNAYCDNGYDEDFAKDRLYLQALRTLPYYALKCYPRFLGTIGGIKINHHMEVIDREDNSIPGLYAAGVDTGGWESDTYNAVLSGTTFGFALNSGRIAGENAAAYVNAALGEYKSRKAGE